MRALFGEGSLRRRWGRGHAPVVFGRTRRASETAARELSKPETRVEGVHRVRHEAWIGCLHGPGFLMAQARRGAHAV